MTHEALMMTSRDSARHRNQPNLVQQRVHAVRWRLQQLRLWKYASGGLFLGGLLGCLTALIRIWLNAAFSWGWVASSIAVPAVAAVFMALRRTITLPESARLIDSVCHLKDRTQTALQFTESAAAESPLRRLQIADAEAHLSGVEPAAVVPMLMPKTWKPGLLLATSAILLGFLATPRLSVLASVTTNATVTAQVSYLTEKLDRLREFQEEQPDPELEKLLEELNQQLTEMSAPGIEPKEALAKLSEMEAALQAMQRNVKDPLAGSHLQEIGEALSLAEPLAAAGEALSKGDMSQAADELARANLPKLDRPTEKAVSEKLNDIQQSLNQTQKNDLKDAVEKMARGIAESDAREFQEGALQLAGECRKQEQKQQLSDMLTKQFLAISEARSEVESESRIQAQTNRKGSQQAGKGTADNKLETKSSRRASGEEMKLAGQDSGTGESEKETITSPEAQESQQAVRQYREQSGKYEALNESVLDSEDIPAGHRQTIRRYFELIRPKGSETDTTPAATQY